MTPFRFRAQAALDLRTGQLRDAQRELARAEADRAAAAARAAETEQALASARHDAAAQQTQGVGPARLQWYRFWIVRLTQQRDAELSLVSARDRAVEHAAAACREAQQRRESLAKFRQKAERAHSALLADAERKAIDELAARRYTAQRQSTSGQEPVIRRGRTA